MNLWAALPTVLVAVVPAMSPVNPANADVAVRLDVALVDFDATRNFFSFTDATFSFLVGSLLRFESFVFREICIGDIVRLC